MCGLVAYYKTSEKPLNPKLVEDMTNAMAHRGADDYGYCFAGHDGVISWRDANPPSLLNGEGVAMGHRRLSIFDLTQAGRQPFVSDDQRLSLVFNGEIYNYVELRDELIKKGYSFTTDCDTEVLLRAYEEWGTECFGKLNGTWAIVIWDRSAGEMIVVRDRVGLKPLFYTQVGEDWIFGSEIKALLVHPDVVPAPDKESLMRFIASGLYPVPDQTFFRDVKAVEPGTFLTFRNGRVNKSVYWQLDTEKLPRRTDVALVKEELNELITDTVKLRMRGDLRVGSMLSGGMDSTSVITSIAQVLKSELTESRSVGDTLHAFTASFTGMAIDETDKVEELCRLIEIDVAKAFPVELDGIEERLHSVSKDLEAPFWTPAVIVQDALMKVVRKSDVQIVLDGLGADEIFSGYDWHTPMVIKDNLGSQRWSDAMGNLSGLSKLKGKNFAKELARGLLPENFPAQLDSMISPFRGKPKSWKDDLFGSTPVPGPTSKPSLGGRSRLERSLKNELLRSNVPAWCQMVDNIGMANSVVTRSPFLDYRMIEFAFSLDDSLKVHKGVPKYILRETKRNELPASIVDDVQKTQFSGPGDLWLKGQLKPFAQSLRDGKSAKLSEYLNSEALAPFIDGYYESGSTPSFAMWRLLNSESWLRAYF